MDALRVGKSLFRATLSTLLISSLLTVVNPIERAHALGAAPTVSFDATAGVTPYTGANGADYATAIGRTVTFTITLTRLTGGQAPIGQVRIIGNDSARHIFCTSNTFSFSGTTATATCNWSVLYTSGLTFTADYLTDPTSSTDYAQATSVGNKKIFVAGIYGVTGISEPLVASSTVNISTAINHDFGGEVSFFANGVAITSSNNGGTSCQNKAVSAAVATCAYVVPANASSITFTFDYTPGTSAAIGLAKQIASYPVQVTVGSYYYPNESTWDFSPAKARGNTYDLSYLRSNFYENNGIFYKLNAANGQAMAVSYDTNTVTNTLTIPSSFSVTSFTSGSVFNRTYTVTQIGREAFWLSSAAPATLLTSITLPNTLTMIRANAFTGQCRVSNLVIPDSVRIIGTGALADMQQSNSIPGCSSAAGATGLNSLTIGSGIESIGDNALKNSQNITSITFKGSPDSLLPFQQDPGNFDGFQYSASYHRVENLGSMDNACSAVINYTGALTSYLLGTQASKWRFWATANSCIPNSNLTIVNTQFAPGPPLQPVAETPTISSLSVSWRAPLNDGDSAITGYSIQYSSNNGSTWTQSNCTNCQIGDSPYVVTGLDPATSYIFRTIATNAIGVSAPSIPSVPVSTLNYTSAPAFTITPAAETVTVGNSTTYSLSSTYPASSYTISPAARNGLSFNTSTGALTGTLLAVETAVAYAVTGTNTIASRTETYTVTVIAAAVAPVQVNIPDPIQTSRISTISQKCVKPDNLIEIKGYFDAKIINIAINGKPVPSSHWSQSSDLITIQWGSNLNSNIEIQIYNGQVPLLTVQRLTFVDQCALEEVKVVTPTPTPTPTPAPTKVANTQPTPEMRKVAQLYFALGSYSVDKSNVDQVAKIASQIMKSTAKTVLIYGHTDSQGGVDNVLLSKNRAKAIYNAVKVLLPGKSVKIGWYAATKPVAQGKNAKAYAQNRRVEIWVK